ncbi:MAG TPA: ABC transporter ATP-binding protein [Paludibacteraceae bacterium]|nr:ABC transporter ATP-binding protein [Paludibacteraceae bacterium]
MTGNYGEFAVCCENITKTYPPDIQALKNIDLKVSPHQIFGIIGPDGAGKTTLFRMLTTLILADEGKATVLGYDVVNDYQEIRKYVGYMPGRFSLYQDLTVEENLKFFASVFGTTVEENYDLIKNIYRQIEPFKNRRAGQLSGGMKQKLALSCALIHKPKLLILDEPTTGVDPVSRKEFWEMLQNLKNEGITILVSTAYMDEAGLCDTIALILNGKFLKIDTPQNIVQQFEPAIYSVQSNQRSKLLNDLRSLPQVSSCYAFGESIHVTVENEKISKEELQNYLLKSGHEQIEVAKIAPTVEDCFMELSKQQEQNN